MKSLKYFIILLLITSCSIPKKEDLYSKSNDLTINKDLDEYGVVVVKFGDFIFNKGNETYIAKFGNVEVCNINDEKCYNLSMYRVFALAFSGNFRTSISGKYYAFKLKPGKYYVKYIQTGKEVVQSYSSFFTNKDQSNYTFNVQINKVTYIGDISVKTFFRGISPQETIFFVKNNFKEAIEAIKKENPLLDVSNAEVDLFKGE